MLLIEETKRGTLAHLSLCTATWFYGINSPKCECYVNGYLHSLILLVLFLLLCTFLKQFIFPQKNVWQCLFLYLYILPFMGLSWYLNFSHFYNKIYYLIIVLTCVCLTARKVRHIFLFLVILDFLCCVSSRQNSLLIFLLIV